MPESPDPLLEAGAAAHERFVRECRDMDVAFVQGRLREWIGENLGDKQPDAEPETPEVTE
jgi:hypothetical protein